MHPYGAFVAFAGHSLLAQVVAEPSWLSKLSEVLHALMTLAILVLAVAVVPAAWNFRKSYQKVSDLLDKVYADINPLAHHASRIGENIDYVTTALRADVQRASATLTDADRRLQDAIRRAEARARDFDALLAVVQDETEGAFVSTASTMRGVRSGMQSLRDTLQLSLRDAAASASAPPPRVRPARRTPEAIDGLDEVRADLAAVDAYGAGLEAYGAFDESDDDAADEPMLLEEELEQLEELNDLDATDTVAFDEEGSDGGSDEHGTGRAQRPRVRPKRGTRE